MKKPLKYLKHELIIALLYLLVAKICLLVPYTQLFTQPIWPVAGISFAVIYFYGYTYLPALSVAAFIVAYSMGLPLEAAAAVGVGNMCEAIISVWILRKFVAEDRHVFDDVKSTIAFFAGSSVAAAAAAMIGALALFFTQNIATDEIITTFYLWFAGDFLGILIAGSMIISWMKVPLLSIISTKEWLERLLALAAAMLSGFVLLGLSRNYRYLLVLMMSALAVRFSRRLVTLTLFLLSALAFGLLALRKLPSSGDAFQDLFIIQTFLGVLVVNTLLLSSVMRQMRTTTEL